MSWIICLTSFAVFMGNRVHMESLPFLSRLEKESTSSWLGLFPRKIYDLEMNLLRSRW